MRCKMGGRMISAPTSKIHAKDRCHCKDIATSALWGLLAMTCVLYGAEAKIIAKFLKIMLDNWVGVW